MSIDVVFPARVQFGIKLQPHPRIKFLVDANWADWEAWETQTIVFDRDMTLLQLAKLMGYTGGDRKLVIENHFKNKCISAMAWSLAFRLSNHSPGLRGPANLRSAILFRSGSPVGPEDLFRRYRTCNEA